VKEFFDMIEHADKAKKFNGDIEVLRFTRVADGFIAAQRRMHLTALGVGLLSFFAGFGICWLMFVR
jgi:hypothetical protein